jgi:hypothetical protein
MFCSWTKRAERPLRYEQLNLLLAGGADDQSRRCGELQRRAPEINAVPSRYLAKLFALLDDRLRDLVVFLDFRSSLNMPQCE